VVTREVAKGVNKWISLRAATAVTTEEKTGEGDGVVAGVAGVGVVGGVTTIGGVTANLAKIKWVFRPREGSATPAGPSFFISIGLGADDGERKRTA
jgi:hypothetical protein